MVAAYTFTAAAVAAAAVAAAAAAANPAVNVPCNVLFIVCDDLRTQLKAYGHADEMVTPHIDALAAESLVFERAYTNYPFCAPSRNSFMSGRLPSKTKAWNFIDHFREPGVGESWVSLPQYFRQHGYWTVGAGKLFHPGLPPNEDNNQSWSEDLVDIGGNEGCNCSTSPGGDAGKMSCQLPDDIGAGCADLVNWQHAAALLTRAGTMEQPFFIGFGIHKPHLPWAVPARFFDSYEEPGGGGAPLGSLPIAAHPEPPQGMPPIAWHTGQWGHFNHSFAPGRPVSDAVARAARQGYFAAVSFADDLVGRTLAALDATGKSNNTVVLLTSDHGWQLGEHGEWCKQTLFDVTLHIPFIIRPPSGVPRYDPSRGRRTAAFAELVDIYRTLAEVTGLPAPPSGTADCVDGVSLAPLLLDPDSASFAAKKPAAFSQMARCLLCGAKQFKKERCPPGVKAGEQYSPFVGHDDCADVPREEIGWMGFSIRTADWRLTDWVVWDGTGLRPDWSTVNATELYSHACLGVACDNDFDATENANVAGLPENAAAVDALRTMLIKHFTT